MEAYEERDIKRDSFEEVDRILAIVEESKKKFDKEEAAYILISSAMIGLLTGIVMFAYNSGFFVKETTFTALIIITLVLCTVIFAICYTREKKIRHEFERTKYLATEVIREVVPTLSRSERWSALRKFELRLRLSKLSISADKIFGHEFDLP